MPNTIEKAKRYVPMLDEVYRESAKTAVLESDSSMSRAGANVNEIIIPKLDMNGLADYSRNDGYVKGDMSLTWETVKFNYERGRMFVVDVMDNEETQDLAFGKLAGEFMRTKVVPEIDAFRFACIAGTEGISKKEEVLAAGDNVISALRRAVEDLNEAEVPAESRILFITPILKGMIDDLDSYKSKSVMGEFSQVVVVPQKRFYTAIKLNDGKSEGETEGGYVKAEGAADINFMVVHKAAVIQFTKHAVPKVIAPENNPDADAFKYGYRNYGLCDVYENKAAGIYCSYAPVAEPEEPSEDDKQEQGGGE